MDKSGLCHLGFACLLENLHKFVYINAHDYIYIYINTYRYEHVHMCLCVCLHVSLQHEVCFGLFI